MLVRFHTRFAALAALAFSLSATAASLSATAALANPAVPTHTPVWVSNEDGIKVYAIPGLLVTRAGTILTYAEARHEGRGDGGKVDVVIKRSTDHGKTWSKSNFIERASGQENYVLATLVQDRASGRIFLFSALRNDGLADKTTTNSYRVSDDDGVTWSKPHDITQLLYVADERIQNELRAVPTPDAFVGDDPELYGRKLFFFGPGRSIQMSADHPRFPNRLVVPLFLMKDRTITPRSKRAYGNAVLVSDDGGKTWNVPGIVPLGEHGSSEVNVVELSDGRLMLNARGAPPKSEGMQVAGRTLSFSSDGGATWTRPAPDTSGIPNYIETHSGLLRIERGAGQTPLLLYSFPNSLPPKGERPGVKYRLDGTILLSEDDGQSWAVRKLLVPGSFGYSNMDVLRDGTVVIVYENSAGTVVTLTRFTLEWLTGGAKR